MTIQELYLKTVFCCMACDGEIAPEEVNMVRQLTTDSDIFTGLKVEEQLHSYIEGINNNGTEFLKNYLRDIAAAELSDEEQLTIVRLAIQTIEADNVIQYSEVKLFKKVRFRLSVTDEQILTEHPDKEDFLLPDIRVTDDPAWENIKFDDIKLTEIAKLANNEYTKE